MAKIIKKTDLIYRLKESFCETFSCTTEDFTVVADTISATIIVHNDQLKSKISNNSPRLQSLDNLLSFHLGLNFDLNLWDNKIIIQTNYTIK